MMREGIDFLDGNYELVREEKKAETTEKSVCIVPAFLFDETGFRLGYGKGYYDRFLKDFTIFSAKARRILFHSASACRHFLKFTKSKFDSSFVFRYLSN